MTVLERCLFLLQSREINVKVGSAHLPQAFFLFSLVTEHSIGNFHTNLFNCFVFMVTEGGESALQIQSMLL